MDTRETRTPAPLPDRPSVWTAVECSGSPFEIGRQHGSAAREQIGRSIDFYAGLFQRNARKNWSEVRQVATQFESNIASKWPRFHDEMRGLAEGSDRHLLDIVALNCRTEIAYGLSQNESDGCTSLWYKTPSATLHGQNWDWNTAQKQNLIYVILHQPNRPTIKMVTEAGIIGKIGLNSAGVGVTFNAIQVPGVVATRLPAHLGLRLALEAESSAAGAASLEAEGGMGACAFIMIGDAREANGLEFTCKTIAKQSPDADGKLLHTNHCLFPHPGMEEKLLVKDSPVRIDRMEKLLKTIGRPGPTKAEFARLFEDEFAAPAAVNRKASEASTLETLFNIVMDLGKKTAVVKVGRPTEKDDEFQISFS